jgi:hypothetical protein
LLGWPSKLSGELSVTNQPIAAIMQAAQIVRTGTNTYTVGGVKVDKAARTLQISAVVNMREKVLEYALVTRSGKTHESLFATDVRPTDVHVAALLLGWQPREIIGLTNQTWAIPESSAVVITASWQHAGRSQQRSLNELIGLAEGESEVITRPLDAGPWFYNGSRMPEGGPFIAEQGGSIVSLIFDPDALVNNPHPDRNNDDIHFPNTSLIPPVGTPVTVEFAPSRASAVVAPARGSSTAPPLPETPQP